MKKLIFIFMAGFSLSSFGQSYYLSNFTKGAGYSATGTSEIIESCVDSKLQLPGRSLEEGIANFMCISALSTTGVSATVIIAAAQKQEIKDVQPDAYNYLAGEPMTLALEEVIFKLKEENHELEQFSDEEIALVIIKLFKEI